MNTSPSQFPLRPDGADRANMMTPGAAGLGTTPGDHLSSLAGRSPESLLSGHGREVDFGTGMLNQQMTPGQRLGMLPPMPPDRYDTSLLFGNPRQDYPSPSPTQATFGPHSDPASRSHSAGVDRRGPLLEFARGYSVPPTSHPQMGYHNSPYQADSFAAQSSQNVLQLLLQEVQKMNSQISGIESTNVNILANQEQLAARVQGNEDSLNSLKESVAMLSTQTISTTKKSTNPSKNISNKHPKLKTTLHPLFFELMGVSKPGERSLLMNQLVAISHLPDDQAFIVVEGSEKKLWRPRWTENVNSKVNTLYIEEIVKCVMRNEKAKRDKGTGSLDDADFDEHVVSIMAKDYFRNIAEQYKTHINPAKARKQVQKQADGRHRGRRAMVATHRRDPQTIDAFEKLFEVQGAAALVDTDFGSDYLTSPEDTLSDDSKHRRKEQDVGKGARMAVGLRWRSVDYVSFLRVLDTIRRRQQTSITSTSQPAAETAALPMDATSNPPAKRRKTGNKDAHKITWDAHPSKMSDRYPDHDTGSSPFRFMVNPAWLVEYPSHKVTDSDGLKWLEGFYTKALEKGELTNEDRGYLDELTAWFTLPGAANFPSATEGMSTN